MNRKGSVFVIGILVVVIILAIYLAGYLFIKNDVGGSFPPNPIRIADLHEVQNALQLYYEKCGYYPGTVQAGTACGSFASISNWAYLTQSLTGSNLGITNIPNDPARSQTYLYGTNGSGTSYVVGATLDMPSGEPTLLYSATGTIYGVNCNPPVFCVMYSASSSAISQSASTTQAWKSYRDAKFGYSFKYPTDWSLGVSSDYVQNLLPISSAPPMNNFQEGAEIDVENWGPNSISTESDFNRLAAGYLQQRCIAGTDQHPIYPTSVESEVTSTNPNGILSIKAYFAAMTDNGPSASETPAGIMGPIYGFYIWPQTGGAANILVLVPGSGIFTACKPSSSTRDELPSIQDIVETLTF